MRSAAFLRLVRRSLRTRVPQTRQKRRFNSLRHLNGRLALQIRQTRTRALLRRPVSKRIVVQAISAPCHGWRGFASDQYGTRKRLIPKTKLQDRHFIYNRYKCPACKTSNPASNAECQKCGKPRPPPMRWDPGPRVSRPVKRDNWWCNSCNASNVASRRTCYRCTSKRTPKTMSEFWRCKSCDHPNRRTHFDCGNCGELHPFIAAVQKKLSPGNRNIYEISKVVLSVPVAAALHDAMVAQGAVPSELDSSALYTLANLTENMALDVLAHMGAMPIDSLSNPGGFIIAVANYYNSPNLIPGFQPMQPMDAAGQQQVKAFVAQCEALRLLPQVAIDDPMLRLSETRCEQN